jgi:hypothetical protein
VYLRTRESLAGVLADPDLNPRAHLGAAAWAVHGDAAVGSRGELVSVAAVKRHRV